VYVSREFFAGFVGRDTVYTVLPSIEAIRGLLSAVVRVCCMRELSTLLVWRVFSWILLFCELIDRIIGTVVCTVVFTVLNNGSQWF